MTATSNTDDLAAWLLQQIAADEQRIGRVALDATGPWRYDRDRFAVDELDEHGQRRFTIASRRDADWPLLDVVGEYLEEFQPDRMRAECDAKRQTVQSLSNWARFDMTPAEVQRASREEWHVVSLARTTLKQMALPYSGRPGYREEWRP